MNKYVLLVIVLAAALTVGLYSRPKVVIRNENKQLGGRTTQTPTADSLNVAANTGTPDRSAIHEKPVTPAQQKRIETLRTELATASPDQQEVAGQKLITLFRDITRYDSAAHYAARLATARPTEQNLLRAGDQYFEAYTFAVDEKKTVVLGQKTRDFYQKALVKNPNLLAAKANMAMTYVSTDTPMQGIRLLRDVLQQDPTNELALFNLGLLSMRSGQYERAVERFRQILVNNPASRKARFYLGISLAEAGQRKEAKQLLAEVKQQETGSADSGSYQRVRRAAEVNDGIDPLSILFQPSRSLVIFFRTFGPAGWLADIHCQPLNSNKQCLAVKNGNGTRLPPTSGRNGSEKPA